MSKINELKRNLSQRFKKLIPNKETEKEDFKVTINEVQKCVNWDVENLHAYTWDSGEYLEGPPFHSGYLNDTKWLIRLYPKGKTDRNSEKVGLFILKVSSSEECSVKYQFVLKDTPDEFVGILDYKETFEVLDEYGGDEFLSSQDLTKAKNLKIECKMLIRYSDEGRKNQAGGNRSYRCNCTLSRDLKDMYLKEEKTDSVLQVRGMKFPVHKAILGARSKVFANMFKREQEKESPADVINIDETEVSIEASVMRNLLQYIYTRNIDGFTLNKAISLYPVAKLYNLQDLQNLCLNVIQSEISVENFCNIAASADKYSPRLKLTIKSFFCKYSSQILVTEDWNNFIVDRRLLAKEMLNTLTSEYKTRCPSTSFNNT